MPEAQSTPAPTPAPATPAPPPSAEHAPAPAPAAPAAKADPAPAPAEPKAAPAPPSPDADWRTGITDEDARKEADKSTDINALARRVVDQRKQLSSAIVRPGKDAKPEDVAAYRKQIDVPATPEGYKFAMPKGVEPTEDDKAFHKVMGEEFHDLNISQAAATRLSHVVNELAAKSEELQAAEDKRFADAAEAELRTQWRGAEYDANKAHGDRAAVWMFGDQIDEVRAMQTKDGRFILDHPVMLRALAATGREMAEGGLVPPMSADAAEQAQSEVDAVRVQIRAAQDKGDTKEANRLFGKEQELLAKIGGSKPIVGSQGRAA